MRFRNIKHKKLTVAIAAVAVLALAGAAFAFWTTTGTGSGSAAGGTAGNFDVTVSFAGGIYPSGTKAVTGTITNNTTSSLEVHTITADTVGFPTTGVTTDNGSCVAADFTFTGTVTGGTQVLAAGGGSAAYTGTLSMADTGLNQDACKAPTVITLHVKAA